MIIYFQDAFTHSRKISNGQTFVPLKQNAQKVFTEVQERHLSFYAIKMAKMFYGLPIKEFRRITYEYAIACNSPAIPEAWKRDNSATAIEFVL